MHIEFVIRKAEGQCNGMMVAGGSEGWRASPVLLGRYEGQMKVHVDQLCLFRAVSYQKIILLQTEEEGMEGGYT